MQEPKSEEEYPSLELAYQYVFYPYEWMLRRVEAVESRIQNFLVFAATFTVGVPIAVVGLNGDSVMLNVWWSIIAILALASFGLVVERSLKSRQHGAIQFPNVGKLPEYWLTTSQEEFRRMAIEESGKHHNNNSLLVEHKSDLADQAVVAFVVEAGLWSIWSIGILLS